MSKVLAMDPLVSTSWLADRLGDPNLAVLDATLPPVGVTPAPDVRGRYVAKHIPGAVFFDIEELSEHGTSLPHMLPSAEAFSESMSAMGIGNQMSIVVYEQEGVFSAPRAWWMLRTFGVKDVFVLDGGLRAWVEEGRPTEAGAVRRERARFEAVLDANAVKGFEEVQRLIASRGQILDARSAGRFQGTAPEPRAGISSGHMPGAKSVPYLDLVEDGRLKGPGKLNEVFGAKGVDLQSPITTSCGSGVTAAVIALALERCGARQVSLYDGSWAEYAQRADAEIVKG